MFVSYTYFSLEVIGFIECSYKKIQPTWRCTQNLKTLAPIGAEKYVEEIFIDEKEKLSNKKDW